MFLCFHYLFPVSFFASQNCYFVSITFYPVTFFLNTSAVTTTAYYRIYCAPNSGSLATWSVKLLYSNMSYVYYFYVQCNSTVDNMCFVLSSGSTSTNPCSHLNGGCEHICLPTPQGPRCSCLDGFNFVSETRCSISTCEY